MGVASLSRVEYPLRYAVDYPEKLNRVSTAFRIIWLIPVLIVSMVVNGTLFLAPLLMILFRRKYPRWWFAWNLELSRFTNRLGASMALLTDQYPSIDSEQAVHLDMDYPDVENDLNRWLPLVKWLLAIPHWFLLIFLWLAAFVVIIIAWFAILFTGRYPSGLFNFVVGVGRWSLRVTAYSILLVTDRYPPFSLDP